MGRSGTRVGSCRKRQPTQTPIPAAMRRHPIIWLISVIIGHVVLIMSNSIR